MICDYLIIGSGLTGATIARYLKDAGKKVLVLERKEHKGGNIYDYIHESGITVHKYGPHYFRTNSERIWKFVNRFSSFYTFEACVKSFVDGEYVNWPVNTDYINKKLGKKWTYGFTGTPKNFEEAALSFMPLWIYEKFVKEYNIKQWGVEPSTLSSNLIKRFDIRQNEDPRLKPQCKYQGIPVNGYNAFIENILKGIAVELECDYLEDKNSFSYKKKVVFTGCPDEYFNYNLGRLKYRSQQRKTTYIPGTEFFQPCVQVNNPLLANGDHIRTIEWKHMMPKDKLHSVHGTVITTETPYSPTDEEEYEYPFPDKQNQQLYKKYRHQAKEIRDLLICGRLGEYRYYDMDQAIGRALYLASSILKSE